MRILADDLSRYELLTPEKTESVLEEAEGHSMFPIPLLLEDGRPDRTVSDDTKKKKKKIRAFTKVKASYQSLQGTAIISCQIILTKTLTTKLTVMSICSTYGR